MSLKGLGVRVAAILPPALLVACSEQEIGEAIENAILDVLAAKRPGRSCSRESWSPGSWA